MKILNVDMMHVKNEVNIYEKKFRSTKVYCFGQNKKVPLELVSGRCFIFGMTGMICKWFGANSPSNL